MSPTEIMDPSIVKAEVVEYLGSVLEDARALSLKIVDDASCEEAIAMGAAVKERINWLKTRRKKVYIPLKEATEGVRLEYDTPIKLGESLEDTLDAGVITYKQKKRDDETRARLALEAEAKRQKEEAARKEREVQAERDRIVRERELEEQKKRDAAEAEERRRQEAEREDQRQIVAKAKAEADERARQLREEEDRRLASAKEAHDVGLAERSETILDKQMPVAPLPAPLPSPAEIEAKAKAERELREAVAERDRILAEEKAAQDKRRADDAERLRKMDEEAAIAKAKAAEAEAIASQQITVTRPDDRHQTSVRWRYDVPTEAEFRVLCLAIGEGRAPVEYGGYNPDKPQDFRGTADLQKDVTRLKDNFPRGIGIRVFPEESGHFKAAAVVA